MSIRTLILRRLLLLPVSLIILITLTFGLVGLLPGDPAQAVAGNLASPEDVAHVSTQLGLDKPWTERYITYINDALHGDLGKSFFTNQPVMNELKQRLPATLELVFLALVVACVLGLALGITGAYYRRTKIDTATRSVVTLFQSTPDFLLGLVLIYLLFYLFGTAPAPVGQLGIEGDTVQRHTGFMLIDPWLDGQPDKFFLYLQHLWLPVLSLGIVYSAFFAKVARSVTAGALSSPQVEFARACGLPESQVIRYAFLQVRSPILTYGAILFGTLIGGAAIIETIFSWGGAGQWALEGILKLDIPVIQGFILAAGLLTITIYLALDVLVVLLDPRVRFPS